ncbi:MAG: hypothetical protein UU02_C0023G0010 [Candidatus Woesebacteria bacterium GW2011_GWA1_40_43]|uniref:Nucleotidyl transferase domain-containing protein n=1 Tax=Candidatus Woesebacteria bacterium GW2011_GWA1_40_43 TaxID=1618553 RepID=A0A0G0VL58_9BACT|nr:MAG: hypothetical protein UT88_C0001G0006 [Candidatus Woesebacteria bacterium GW2011_GWD2_40_19]KKR57085.1 MAG: hypothetical protein UT96_C0027G0014 [Candidatus Woesebacteria bacterium GW2011_GWC2_40_30]KKR63532.1 MAG: hypothetical protein UU02_C0023G0010 [Candidatus Woesebacteria bacterium GW2011_GWA1_40_43]
MSHELRLDNSSNTEGLQTAPSSAYVLSAGFGTRMETLTQGKFPKGLVEIEQGKVLLEFVFDIAKDNGVNKIVTCVSHQSEKIIDFCAVKGWGSDVSFSIESTPQGVIKTFETGLKNFPPVEDFVLLHGDEIIANFSLQSMYKFHLSHKGLATGLLSSNPQAKRTVIMKLDDNGKVSDSLRDSDAIHSDYLASLGLFIFSPKIINEVGRFKTWEEMVKTFSREGKLYGFSSKAYFFNINSPKDISDFLDYKRNNKA